LLLHPFPSGLISSLLRKFLSSLPSLPSVGSGSLTCNLHPSRSTQIPFLDRYAKFFDPLLLGGVPVGLPFYDHPSLLCLGTPCPPKDEDPPRAALNLLDGSSVCSGVSRFAFCTLTETGWSPLVLSLLQASPRSGCRPSDDTIDFLVPRQNLFLSHFSLRTRLACDGLPPISQAFHRTSSLSATLPPIFQLLDNVSSTPPFAQPALNFVPSVLFPSGDTSVIQPFSKKSLPPALRIFARSPRRLPPPVFSSPFQFESRGFLPKPSRPLSLEDVCFPRLVSFKRRRGGPDRRLIFPAQDHLFQTRAAKARGLTTCH